MMSWIALAALFFTVISTVFAAISAGFRRVAGKFDEHERLDQERHADNLQRFARIETTLEVIRNGSH